jgi:hypothetical protein
MSGHSAQSLHHKKIIDKDQLYAFNWILSHIRNITVCVYIHEYVSMHIYIYVYVFIYIYRYIYI